MRRHPACFWSLLFLVSIFSGSCRQKPPALFERLTPDQTGIRFANRIRESDSLNILTNEYIYNGGGVGIGDFNNDSLEDIYFSGNMVSNKLYLNQGDFKFTDITRAARVTGEGKWCSGVVLVDINNDGWLDIYVGATMKTDTASLANLLYINNGVGPSGIPTFTESAAKYGLADTGHTTTAAFFDYDRDGDLDLYVLTNVINEGLPTTFHYKKKDGSAENNDRLYGNNGNGTFTNVTREAGILIEGFGLGLAISDINLDGWPDIYVTNDYLSNDLLYINNRDGTFTDRIQDYIRHTSYSAMGNSVTDINNDGLVDILALDMLPENNKRKKLMVGANNYAAYINNDLYGYQHQYGRNTLQLNQGMTPAGHPVFSEVGQLAGLYQTDWSWAPLVADFDNDGLRDVIITNGFPRDVTDHDFQMYRSGPAGTVGSNLYLIDSIPVIKISNYAFHNQGGLRFRDVTQTWGLDLPAFSNGAAYADLDNDGDLDFVVNNINDSAFVYRNRLYQGQETKASQNYLRLQLKGATPNIAGIGAKVSIYYGSGKQQFYEHSPYKGYLSTVDNIAHFGLGKTPVIDSLKVTWPDGRSQVLNRVKPNRVVTLAYKNAAWPPPPAADPGQPAGDAPLRNVSRAYQVLYKHAEADKIDFNIQKTLPHKLTQYGPGIAVGDVDGNGLDDFYIGGAAYKNGIFFLQQQSGTFKAGTGAFSRPGAKPEEEMGVLLFDADQDGDLDLYGVSGSYEYEDQSPYQQDKLYRNDGKGHFTYDARALPALAGSGSCVRAADYDRDGDLDLFVGGRVVPGKYPLPPASYILQNTGGRFTDVTPRACPALAQLGMVSDALWSDFDQDGQVDLVIAGEWLPITFLKNNRGKFTNVTAASGIGHQTGWWNSLAAGDFDQDGDTDYLAGNLGRNTNYVATPAMPLKVYAKDFDQNGSIDPVLACFMKGEDGRMHPFPMHSRDDLNAQMPRTRSIFPRYANYSVATIDQVLPANDRQQALELQATQFASSYLQNLGGGKFKMTPLPTQAQLAPVYGMLVDDVNLDGYPDVLLTGNDYGTEVFTGRYDAFFGLYLQGTGKGTFIPRRIRESGFFVPGDAKGVAALYGKKGEKLVVVTQNQDSLKVFGKTGPAQATERKARTIALLPTDAGAIITYRNGKKEKVEFYYGHTFLSQSARRFQVTPAMASVVIFGYTGKSRKYD